MKNLSNNKLLSVITVLLFLTLFAKLLAVAVLWVLPPLHPKTKTRDIPQAPYMNYDFKVMIDGAKAKKREHKAPLSKAADITSMLLVGLYGNASYGYAIVAMKSEPKNTKIISIGEEYQGYRLKRVALDYVVFVKNNKEYILRLKRDTVTAKELYSSVKKSVSREKNKHIITHREISNYIKNPKALWRDISINEVKKNGKIVGFKVTKIKSKSPLARLGLQVGDLITQANGVVLDGYTKVLKIYKNINKIQKISLVIQRGNKEKEIIYEIH